MIKQLTGNLVRYGIFPENPNEGLAEKDEFIRNVQNKYQAFLERPLARHGSEKGIPIFINKAKQPALRKKVIALRTGFVLF